MHLVQLNHPTLGRRVGIVKEPDVILLDKGIGSSYQLFKQIVNSDRPAIADIEAFKTKELLKYDDIYISRNDWQILPPVDCPG